jgi:hypothetical protein
MFGAVTLLSLACAPPDAPLGTLPEIRLIYPTDATVLEAVGAEGASTCTVTSFVAVDILNFTFEPPSPDQAVVEGQGHYHVDAGTSSVRPHELFDEAGVFEGVPCPDEGDTETTLRIRAYLVTAAHEDINDSDEHEDVAEPTIVFVEAKEPKGKD